MNILILSTKMPWPPRDGGAIATLNLAMGLAQNGANVTLLTMNTRKHYSSPAGVPDQIKKQINIRYVDIDTRIRPFRLLLNYLFNSYPYIAERFISKPFRQELEKCLEENRYDIIQMEGPYLGYYRQFIGDGPLVSLRAHNLEHRIWELRALEEKNPLKRLYFRSLSRRILKLETELVHNIDLLIPISEADGKGFRELNPDLPVHVSETGLDLDKYPFQAAEGPPRLFFIGALDWGPNQEGLNWFFKKVWPKIISRWPGIMLNIAGRNPSGFLNVGLPPNVKTEGEVEDAFAFFKAHNIMIVPLLSGSGLRIKILEAMAMGIIVISSSIGASGIDAKNGMDLFIADSAEDYLSILETLSMDQDAMHETSLRARQFVTKKFDNFVQSDKLISFYKRQLT